MLSYLPMSIRYPFNAKVSKGFKIYDGMSVLAIKSILKTYTWSPIVWQNGHRLESNFISAKFIALDFENPEVSMESIINDYSDTWHIVGTTRNHQKWKGDIPPCDRFRLLLRFEHTITNLDQYKYNMKYLADSKGADEKCVDGARLLFPCTDIVSVLCGEDLYDESVKEMPKVEPAKSRGQIYMERVAFHKSYGRLSSFCMRWLLNEIPLGQKRVTFFLLGKELCRHGIEYEDAVRRVLASPTCLGRTDGTDLIEVVRSQVYGGFKAIWKESNETEKRT